MSTRDNIDGSDRDDDIDYSILGLHLLEQHGAALSPNTSPIPDCSFCPSLRSTRQNWPPTAI
ncbi:hypothetical protein ACWEOE_40650 [Amycolatopsis sp. NPDC004368]